MVIIKILIVITIKTIENNTYYCFYYTDMIQESSDDDEGMEEVGTFDTFQEMMRKRKQVVDDVKTSQNQREESAPVPEMTSKNKMVEEVEKNEEVKREEEEECNLQLYAFVARLPLPLLSSHLHH